MTRFAVLGLLAAMALAPAQVHGQTRETRVLESREFNRDQASQALKLEANILCVDGYRYLFVFHPRPHGDFPFSGLSQMFEIRDGQSVPSRCQ